MKSFRSNNLNSSLGDDGLANVWGLSKLLPDKNVLARVFWSII